MSIIWACGFCMAMVVDGSRVETVGGSAMPLLLQKVQSLSQHPRSASAVLPLLTLLQTNSHKKWTAGANVAISDVEKQLEKVQISISTASAAVEKEISDLATSIKTSVRKTAEDKSYSARFRADQWVLCVGHPTLGEVAAMDDIIAKQKHYNQMIQDQQEPCDLENSTQFFNTVSAAMTITCHLDVAGEQACKTGLQDLSAEATSTTDGAADYVEGKVKAHTDAETLCGAAKLKSANALTEVTTSQGTWRTRHSECANLKQHRNWAICEFGNSLKRICEKKRSYDRMVWQAKRRGSVYSIDDRLDEISTVLMVRCLLKQFLQKDMDIDVESCQSPAPESSDAAAINAVRDIDLHEQEVEQSYDYQKSQFSTEHNMKARCDADEGWFFRLAEEDRFYEVPTFATVSPYDGTWESPEQQIVGKYVPSKTWVTTFHENATVHFAECNDMDKPADAYDWKE